MNLDHESRALLLGLFTVAQAAERPALGRLVQVARIHHSAVLRSLATLRAAGLVQDHKVRLTFTGLALAAQLRAPRRRVHTARAA